MLNHCYGFFSSYGLFYALLQTNFIIEFRTYRCIIYCALESTSMSETLKYRLLLLPAIKGV